VVMRKIEDNLAVGRMIELHVWMGHMMCLGFGSHCAFSFCE
jgi:hypothetical protein